MAKDKRVQKATKKARKATAKKIDQVAEKVDVDRGAKDSSKVWSIFSVVAAVGAASVAKKVLNGGWKAATGKTPPANPADPDVEFREAVMWAAASGTFVALARMLAQRKAADYFHRSTGHLPPGLQKD